MKAELGEVETRLGYRFRRPALLETALTHPSADPRLGAEMERLEFLGDALLALAVGSLLFGAHPGAREGELTRMRSRLVNTRFLAQKAKALGLDRALVLGKGEEKTGGRKKDSILAGALEALLGAVFLDGGYARARDVVRRVWAKDVREAPLGGIVDAKTALQEFTQRQFGKLPVYETADIRGPDHAREFHVRVSLGDRVLGEGTGPSKRSAAQKAARQALEILRGRGK
ncbi:MAG: ribonuclease 3 [Candidatus Binatia bacterium]|nr:MAG: ribonuclease 3 [Candidatus Binatia bacterium]